jgi:hypothetical protein
VFKDNTGTDQTQISLLGLPVINYHVECVNKAHGNVPHRDIPGECLREFVGVDEGIEEAMAQVATGVEPMVACLYAASALSEHTGLCPYNCKDTIDENS